MSIKEDVKKFLSKPGDWIIDGYTLSWGWDESPKTEILYEDDETMTVRYRFASEEQKKHYMNAHDLKKDIKK